jgi:hypothetical protein
MNANLKWKVALTFILSLSFGGVASSARAGWFSSDCYYLPIPCAEGEKLPDTNWQEGKLKVSVQAFTGNISSVCYSVDTEGGFITDEAGCDAKKSACANADNGYGGCLRTVCTGPAAVLDGTTSNASPTNEQAYFCDEDPFQKCQMYVQGWKNGVASACKTFLLQTTPGDDSGDNSGTAPTAPQCAPATAQQDCRGFISDEEAVCNDISCVNERCHFVGHASGEYTWVNEPGKRSHHPLPTHFPPCSYANKPHAYCTNSGLSGLDYCFPADQPRADNTGASGAGAPSGNTNTNCPTTILGLPNVGCMNFNVGSGGPGSTLVCPDGKSATPACINYDMDPALVAGQPAFPPDCCQ